MLGLTAGRVRALHVDYVGTLVAFANRDRVVTSREREDLDLVAEALGVGGLEEALRTIAASAGCDQNTSSSLQGKSVCFTGALVCSYEGRSLTRDLAERLAAEAGLWVNPRVTRTLDLLVVADPNSMSGKARKARQYGTRVMAETAFWPMIGVQVQ